MEKTSGLISTLTPNRNSTPYKRLAFEVIVSALRDAIDFIDDRLDGDPDAPGLFRDPNSDLRVWWETLNIDPVWIAERSGWLLSPDNIEAFLDRILRLKDEMETEAATERKLRWQQDEREVHSVV